MEATSVQHPGKFVACASGHCLFSSGLGDVGGEQPVQIGSDPDARAFEPIIEFYAMDGQDAWTNAGLLTLICGVFACLGGVAVTYIDHSKR